jgi:hypothetical protein
VRQFGFEGPRWFCCSLIAAVVHLEYVWN